MRVAIALAILSLALLACTSPEEYCIKHGGEYKTIVDDEVDTVCIINGTMCQAQRFQAGEPCPPPCEPCPQLMPPSPDFCKNGTIVLSAPDRCGCRSAPAACVTS